MPNERYFEILLARCHKVVFGHEFALVSQQLTLPSGRVDLVLKEKNGTIHLVEVKKDKAVKKGIEQAQRYVRSYNEQSNIDAQGWVVANQITQQVKDYAKELGIKTLAIPETQYDKILREAGVESSALLGDRIQAGILIGAGVQNFGAQSVAFDEAVLRINNQALRQFLLRLNSDDKFTFPSGTMQTKIVYRGIGIGGVNRGHRHSYISSNVVLNTEDANLLMANGFKKRTKTQSSSSHVHVWWQTHLDNVDGLKNAIFHFSELIEKLLFS